MIKHEKLRRQTEGLRKSMQVTRQEKAMRAARASLDIVLREKNKPIDHALFHEIMKGVEIAAAFLDAGLTSATEALANDATNAD